MADFHQLNIASRESMMSGNLDGRRINRANMVAIMVFDNAEVFQECARDRARPIPIFDMNRLRIRRAVEFDPVKNIPQFRQSHSYFPAQNSCFREMAYGGAKGKSPPGGAGRAGAAKIAGWRL